MENAVNMFMEGYNKEINLIYGPSASGKTTLAIIAAVELAKKGKKVLYLDTENGLSVERIEQIGGKDVLENIFVIRLPNFWQQWRRMKELKEFVKKGNFSMVVIDTLSMHYRMILQEDAKKANNYLVKQLNILKSISDKIPVIIINQVSTDPSTGEMKVSGGNMVKKYGVKVVELYKEPRKIKIIKPFEREISFEIDKFGINLV